ncbi:MAG: hypothetical protein SGARI_006613, partial [Bacillariaceae sp.]
MNESRRPRPIRSRMKMKRALRSIIPLAACMHVVAGAGGGQPRGIIYGKEDVEEQSQMQGDVCGMDLEENHIGKLYLEFNGEPRTLTDDDILDLQDLVSDVYSSASTESCLEGYRSLYGIEIDRDAIVPSEYGNQFRVQVNVMTRCKGCSHDLRFFSSTNAGRSQGRFLEQEQDGLLGRRKSDNGLFGNRDDTQDQEAFLQEPSCHCSPPSRDRMLDGLRIRLNDQQHKGKLGNFQELASVGAYFSGLKTRQIANGGVQKITRPELVPEADVVQEKTEDHTTCYRQPPFSEPFDLPDQGTFDGISSCPFQLHELVLGDAVESCFPIYDIPHWYSEHSVTFMLHQLKLGRKLFFEKEPTNEPIFAQWEDLIEVTTMDDYMETKSCLDRLPGFSAVGVRGEISGEAGMAKISAVI